MCGHPEIVYAEKVNDMPAKTPITVAHGDGIGPEIMNASLQILEAAGAALDVETIEIGEKVYLRGNTAGIDPSAWESLRRTKVFYKAPITTPQGGGFKSLNVTARKALGLYANVRPCVSYHPFVDTLHPNMDVVIVRENEEDLYAGIEYRLSDAVTECLKLISRPACEKIVRYAFEYAIQHGRRKVACFTKDNVMKMTDGLFHKVFDEIGADYPAIEKEHWFVDIGAAKLADTPTVFDVIVMPNLYGDILSDVAAQIAGSVGLAGSANIGTGAAMFEAIHGAAPRRAGQNVANPTGLLLGGVLMLVHIGQPEVAARVHNAWLRTIEDGIHTYDIFDATVSREKVGTMEFARAVIARLGQVPNTLKVVKYGAAPEGTKAHTAAPIEIKKETVGVDLYVEWLSKPEDLAALAAKANGDGLALNLIFSRGVKVWPEGMAETFCLDAFSCRFFGENGAAVTQRQIAGLARRVVDLGLCIVQAHVLRTFDGKLGYSLVQGQ